MAGADIDLLSILLGAALAVGGGLIGQRQEQKLRRQREEEDLLFEINDTLLELHGVLEQTGYYHAAIKTTSMAQAQVLHGPDLVEMAERMNKLAIRLRRRDNREFAVRLTKLALDPEYRTKKNVYQLIRGVQLRLNQPVIADYEKQIEGEPGKF